MIWSIGKEYTNFRSFQCLRLEIGLLKSYFNWLLFASYLFKHTLFGLSPDFAYFIPVASVVRCRHAFRLTWKDKYFIIWAETYPYLLDTSQLSYFPDASPFSFGLCKIYIAHHYLRRRRQITENYQQMATVISTASLITSCFSSQQFPDFIYLKLNIHSLAVFYLMFWIFC